MDQIEQNLQLVRKALEQFQTCPVAPQNTTLPAEFYTQSFNISQLHVQSNIGHVASTSTLHLSSNIYRPGSAKIQPTGSPLISSPPSPNSSFSNSLQQSTFTPKSSDEGCFDEDNVDGSGDMFERGSDRVKEGNYPLNSEQTTARPCAPCTPSPLNTQPALISTPSHPHQPSSLSLFADLHRDHSIETNIDLMFEVLYQASSHVPGWRNIPFEIFINVVEITFNVVQYFIAHNNSILYLCRFNIIPHHTSNN